MNLIEFLSASVAAYPLMWGSIAAIAVGCFAIGIMEEGIWK